MLVALGTGLTNSRRGADYLPCNKLDVMGASDTFFSLRYVGRPALS